MSCDVTADGADAADGGQQDWIVKRGNHRLEVLILATHGSPAMGRVVGSKRSPLGKVPPAEFTVYFVDNKPLVIDGRGRAHPLLVLEAANAAWAAGRS